MKIIKGTSIILSGAMLGALFIETGFTTVKAHAQTVSTQEENPVSTKYPKFVSEDQANGIIENNLTSLTSQQIKEIQNKVAEHARTEIQGNETIVSIDDNVLTDQIMNVIAPETSVFSSRARKGTTKIVFHGSKTKGNFDIYLSAGTLNLAKKSGYGVLAQVALLPLAAIGGPVGFGIRAAVKGSLTAVLVKASGKGFKYGRVFHFKGGNYKSWSHQ